MKIKLRGCYFANFKSAFIKFMIIYVFSCVKFACLVNTTFSNLGLILPLMHFSQTFRACRRLKLGGLSRQWQAFPPSPTHPNQFRFWGRTAGTILGFLCCLCAIVVVVVAHRVVVVVVVVVAIMLSCALEFVVSFFDWFCQH